LERLKNIAVSTKMATDAFRTTQQQQQQRGAEDAFALFMTGGGTGNSTLAVPTLSSQAAAAVSKSLLNKNGRRIFSKSNSIDNNDRVKNRNGTQFIDCPAGCGRRMLERDVNDHLDRCFSGGGGGAVSEEAGAGATNKPMAKQSPLLLGKKQQQGSRGILTTTAGTKRRRVLCPVCSTSYPDSLINLHLDRCMQRKHENRSSSGSETQGRQVRQTLPSCEILNTSSCTMKVTQEADDMVSKSSNAKKEQSHDDFLCLQDSAPELNGCSLSDLDGRSRRRSTGSPTVAIAHNSQIPDTLGEEIATSTEAPSSGVITSEGKSLDKEIATYRSTASEAAVAKVSIFPVLLQHRNVFAQMMKQSKRSCAQTKTATILPTQSSFHLHAHRITLSHSMALPKEHAPTWSASVQIKDESGVFNVIVSSSVANHSGPPIRWVQRHSRLTVPVLKSILQKACRRRKPLPAVRVAMELADKSLGDLLRRLPIIVLEDSALHPDLDFLVWIMMAQSKDFVPSRQNMTRVFQIVFEIASCPLSDPLPSNDDTGAEPAVTLRSLYDRPSRLGTLSSEELSSQSLLWSMLVRGKYGGMKCDVMMLQKYTRMWSDRFDVDDVPEVVISRINPRSADGSDKMNMKWSDIPHLLHRKAKQQSLQRVSSLCENGIDQLLMSDVCIEGVDFHCSAILEDLLVDPHIFGMCHDILVLSSNNVPDSTKERRHWLESIVKQCMWKYSSGINHRRPICTDNETPCEADGGYFELWKELFSDRAIAYQKRYIQQRLYR
jgi:hypothetical protein